MTPKENALEVNFPALCQLIYKCLNHDKLSLKAMFGLMNVLFDQ